MIAPTSTAAGFHAANHAQIGDRMRRIFVNPWRNDVETRKFSQNIETDYLYKVDFSKAATSRGSVTVSSVAWTSKGSRTATITGNVLSSGVSSGIVSADNPGNVLIKVVATYSDATTDTQYIEIIVEDPEYKV